MLFYNLICNFLRFNSVRFLWMAGLRLGSLELRLLKSIFASEEIKYALENMPDFLPPDTDRNQTEALKIVLQNTEGLLIHKKRYWKLASLYTCTCCLFHRNLVEESRLNSRINTAESRSVFNAKKFCLLLYWPCISTTSWNGQGRGCNIYKRSKVFHTTHKLKI